MRFITNKNILRLSNLSNMIASYGAAVAIAAFGGFTVSAIIIGACLGGWSLSNGYIARRLLKIIPDDANKQYTVLLDPVEHSDLP